LLIAFQPLMYVIFVLLSLFERLPPNTQAALDDQQGVPRWVQWCCMRVEHSHDDVCCFWRSDSCIKQCCGKCCDSLQFSVLVAPVPAIYTMFMITSTALYMMFELQGEGSYDRDDVPWYLYTSNAISIASSLLLSFITPRYQAIGNGAVDRLKYWTHFNVNFLLGIGFGIFPLLAASKTAVFSNIIGNGDVMLPWSAFVGSLSVFGLIAGVIMVLYDRFVRYLNN